MSFQVKSYIEISERGFADMGDSFLIICFKEEQIALSATQLQFPPHLHLR